VQTAAMQLTVEVFSASFKTTLNTDIPITGVFTTQVRCHLVIYHTSYQQRA